MSQLQQFRHIHLIGIGGSGMSAIAWILLQRGFSVSGSDLAANDMTRKLSEHGARIFIGHHAANIADADLVVTSTAINGENPERSAAEQTGVTIWRRARVLAEIMRGGRAIAVSGTHGKTTTTSMVGLMLTQAGLDPTVLIGGELNDFGGNARLGHGEWVVAEADESDGSFLEMEPDLTIVTNIEADHLDYYADHAEIVRTFEQFVSQIRPGGTLVACLDDPAAADVAARGAHPVLGYGLSAQALASPLLALTAEILDAGAPGRGARFVPIWRGERLPEVTLRIPGRHNVLNALGALAAGIQAGAAPPAMLEALAGFHGAKRRFQLKGVQGGITVVDDYGHHPTEIAATLSAARNQLDGVTGGGRLVGVFQPHRYSRTRALAAEFGQALQACDLVVVMDVYSAGERPIDGISGRTIHDRVVAGGHPAAYYQAGLDDARSFLAGRLEPGDMCLTIGAGNVYKVGEGVLEDLKLRETATAGLSSSKVND